MHELKSLDASEDKPLTNSPLLENEESFIKKVKNIFHHSCHYSGNCLSRCPMCLPYKA